MKPANSPFWKDIEGLRAIAVLGVMLFHADVPYLKGGYVGVDVFYVISGFLITGLMLRDSAQSPRAFLAGFYARRVRRILPAATVVIIVTLAFAAVIRNALENGRAAGDALSATFFYSNVHFAGRAADYFSDNDAPSMFQHYWSLSLEEQFYFVWPVLFCLLRRWGRRAIVIGLVIVVVFSFALSLWWTRTKPIDSFYLLPPRAWELGIGALIATNTDALARVSSRIRAFLGLLGAVALVAAMLAFTKATPFPGVSALLPTVGTAFLIIAGLGDSHWAGYRVLAMAPLQWLGRYSFSLYLWHWPVVILKVERFKWLYKSWPRVTLVMFAATIPAAFLTYHLVEEPPRKLEFFRSTLARTFVLGAVCILIAAGASWGFQRLIIGSKLSTSHVVASTQRNPSVPVSPTDFVPANLDPPLAETVNRNWIGCSPCSFGKVGASRRIVLYGDSHATHWAGALDDVASELGLQLDVRVTGHCVSYDVPVALLPFPPRDCDETRRATVYEIMTTPPDLVVLSNKSYKVFEKNPSEWERGIRAGLRALKKVTKVVVLAETPTAASSIPLCLAAHLENAKACDVQWPTALNARLKTIAVEEGATYVDLEPLFCANGRCPAITDDMLIYTDKNHVTVAYALARADWLKAHLPIAHQ